MSSSVHVSGLHPNNKAMTLILRSDAVHKRRSALQIRAELAAKGVDRAIVDEVMQEYDETNAARQMLQVLISRHRMTREVGDEESLSSQDLFAVRKAMFSKGFSSDSLQAALDALGHSEQGVAKPSGYNMR